MKTLISSLVLGLVLLANCNPRTSSKSSEDSIRKAKIDSVKQHTRADSIAAIKFWRGGYFKDEFGDATRDGYVSTSVTGVFSNSATSSSNLFVEVMLTKEEAAIFLREYNSTSSPSKKFSEGVQIQMKNEAEERITIRGYGEWNKSGGVKIENASYSSQYSVQYYSQLKKFLQNSEGRVKVVLSDNYSSIYNFAIETKGFNEEFKKLSPNSGK